MRQSEQTSLSLAFLLLSPSLPASLILLSRCCEVLSLTVRVTQSLAQTSPSPLPASRRALKIRLVSLRVSLPPCIYLQVDREGKGKLIAAQMKLSDLSHWAKCSAGLSSFSRSQTAFEIQNIRKNCLCVKSALRRL